MCRIVPQFTSKQHIVFPAQCSKCTAIAQYANLRHDFAQDSSMHLLPNQKSQIPLQTIHTNTFCYTLGIQQLIMKHSFMLVKGYE